MIGQFDLNLRKGERSLGARKDAKDPNSPEAKKKCGELFVEAAPKITEALKNLSGNSEFAKEAFPENGTRLPRTKSLITADSSFDEEPKNWCMRQLMQKDPKNAGSPPNVDATEKLTEAYKATAALLAPLVEAAVVEAPAEEAAPEVTREMLAPIVAPPPVNPEDEESASVKSWPEAKRKAYLELIALLDGNLHQAEVNLGALETMKPDSPEGLQRSKGLFGAVPNITDALVKLRDNEAFVTEAFPEKGTRLPRIKQLITAECPFDEDPAEWCTRMLMKKDPKNAGSPANVDAVDKLIDAFASTSAWSSSALVMKTWSVGKRKIYDDTLQMFDQNLLIAERCCRSLQAMANVKTIKGRSSTTELFEALSKISIAVDKLNQGIKGSHDFLAAAFAEHSDRLARLQTVLTGKNKFNEEPTGFSVRVLQKDPDAIGITMHTKTVEHLIKSFMAVIGVVGDHNQYHRNKTAVEFKIRTVEESGINVEPNKAALALEASHSRMRRTPSAQGQALFDVNMEVMRTNLPKAEKLVATLQGMTLKERLQTKGMRTGLELMDYLTKLRDAMDHLTTAEHHFLTAAFADKKNTARILDLLTGGSAAGEPPRGGVLKLMAEDEEQFGQRANVLLANSLVKLYEVALSVASDYRA